MPGFALERRFEGLVAGLDEAGRGPLAGPVVAAALAVPGKRVPRGLRGLVDDSKRLSAARRAEALEAIRAAARRGDIVFAAGAASAREVDALDPLRATFLAWRRALARLGAVPAHVLVDGDRAPNDLAAGGAGVTTVVGGDARSFSIEAARCVALRRGIRPMAGRPTWDTGRPPIYKPSRSPVPRPTTD